MSNLTQNLIELVRDMDSAQKYLAKQLYHEWTMPELEAIEETRRAALQLAREVESIFDDLHTGRPEK